MCLPMSAYSENSSSGFSPSRQKDRLELHRPVEVKNALFDAAGSGYGGGNSYGFRKILVGLEVNNQ